MQIGRRVFFDKAAGDIILDTGERQGSVVETTIEQDVSTFTSLSERNRDTFDVIELPYGQYSQDFATCNGYRVNPTTKEIEFSYPIPGEPDAPQAFEKPLSVQVKELANSNDFMGMQMVEKDLQVMELQNSNDFMGMQLVEKDMEIFDLQNENETLGAQIVDMDIRLMMGGL